MIFFIFLSMRSSRSHVQSYGFNELPGLTLVFFSLPFFRLNLFFFKFCLSILCCLGFDFYCFIQFVFYEVISIS